MHINYDGRIFQPVVPPRPEATDGTGIAEQPPSAGDVGPDTLFRYRQTGDVVWATYLGGSVRFGTLIARLEADGSLDARYQQVSLDGTIKAGRCTSTPEFLPDGRLRLHEEWTWTEGATGSGSSLLEEL